MLFVIPFIQKLHVAKACVDTAPICKLYFSGDDAPPRAISTPLAVHVNKKNEIFHLTPKSQEVQTWFANVPKHLSPLSCLTKFKGYIKKNYQTFLDAIPIRPKLKITSLDVVTLQ